MVWEKRVKEQKDRLGENGQVASGGFYSFFIFTWWGWQQPLSFRYFIHQVSTVCHMPAPAEKMPALIFSADRSPGLTVTSFTLVMFSLSLHFWILVGSITPTCFLSKKVSTAEIQMFWVGLLWSKVGIFINSFMNPDSLNLQTGKLEILAVGFSLPGTLWYRQIIVCISSFKYL